MSLFRAVNITSAPNFDNLIATNLPMPDEQGGRTPARLWSRFSEKASSLLPYREMLSLPEEMFILTLKIKKVSSGYMLIKIKLSDAWAIYHMKKIT